MSTAIRVSLTPALKRERLSGPPCLPLLDPAGPSVCMGGEPGSDGLAIPVKPDTTTFFGPRGACLMGDDGPLWVCDTGHHRLLGWRRSPNGDDVAADWVIGQPDRVGVAESKLAHTAISALSTPVAMPDES